ncbi:ABC transporter ATP-binding protein [Phycicoccus sp. Soil803]|uniref:ABC transporter ATP-binding protein n=1 Tax=Phycicoccus sp. Soil803 TaxID=1736415 RepID=UPI0007088E70|nr:ABC transporter ATP-binding protein [Phycicoccus sp. Soil803]KRF21839.1 ABC transporter ATP-binding protein [Phycicoccus sp. Soil803]
MSLTERPNVEADTRAVEALRVERLSMTLKRRGESRPLLDEVSLVVRRGETIGLVGESGSGKSLTSRSAIGLFPTGAKVSGSVDVNGLEVVGASKKRVREVRTRHAAMVFQDPRASINPVRRIGDFLTEGTRMLGMSGKDAGGRAVELLREVGIREPERAMRAFPHQFSGGMLQRVMIASALMNSPSLLLADEATTALDVTTQAEVLGLLARLQQSHGTGTLLVTHDLELAAATCDRVYVMYAGRIVESAPSAELFGKPLHPYTHGLIASSPSVRGERQAIKPIAGRPLALVDAPDGCSFRDRCPLASEECAAHEPELVSPSSQRLVACHHPQEGAVL